MKLKNLKFLLLKKLEQLSIMFKNPSTTKILQTDKNGLELILFRNQTAVNIVSLKPQLNLNKRHAWLAVFELQNIFSTFFIK